MLPTSNLDPAPKFVPVPLRILDTIALASSLTHLTSLDRVDGLCLTIFDVNPIFLAKLIPTRLISAERSIIIMSTTLWSDIRMLYM
jgi:hypothetical protein